MDGQGTQGQGGLPNSLNYILPAAAGVAAALPGGRPVSRGINAAAQGSYALQGMQDAIMRRQQAQQAKQQRQASLGSIGGFVTGEQFRMDNTPSGAGSKYGNILSPDTESVTGDQVKFSPGFFAEGPATDTTPTIIPSQQEQILNTPALPGLEGPLAAAAASAGLGYETNTGYDNALTIAKVFVDAGDVSGALNTLGGFQDHRMQRDTTHHRGQVEKGLEFSKALFGDAKSNLDEQYQRHTERVRGNQRRMTADVEGGWDVRAEEVKAGKPVSYSKGGGVYHDGRNITSPQAGAPSPGGSPTQADVSPSQALSLLKYWQARHESLPPGDEKNRALKEVGYWESELARTGALPQRPPAPAPGEMVRSTPTYTGLEGLSDRGLEVGRKLGIL
jgi:hypothetical protein